MASLARLHEVMRALALAVLLVSSVAGAQSHAIVATPHDALETLAPGASRTFELSLDVFRPPLPAGTYTIDCGEREGIDAAPVSFVVAP